MKYEKGFSLVQVIISLGLVSGLFVAGLKIFQNQTSLGKTSSFRFESLVIMDEIKSTLADSASCKATLSNLSSVFDEVREIKRYDPAKKKSDVVFGIHSVLPKALGQSNVYLIQINLNGELKGFANENGYTTVNLTFSEKAKGGEKFKGSFPIRVSTNELGRIIRCQARPGLHQEKSSRTIKDPWNKVKEGATGDVTGVAYIEGPVNLGNAPEVGKLNVEGGVLLFDSFKGEEECDVKGALTFDGARQNLFVCSDEGKWHKLHDNPAFLLGSKTFTLNSSASQPIVETTDEKFAFCRLEKMEGGGGQCSAGPINSNERFPQWELMVQHFRGSEVSCLFNCYR